MKTLYKKYKVNEKSAKPGDLIQAARRKKPKGARGRAQVARLGRTYKTGGFSKISAKAGKEYKSAAAGKRVAGFIFHKMAMARGRA